MLILSPWIHISHHSYVCTYIIFNVEILVFYPITLFLLSSSFMSSGFLQMVKLLKRSLSVFKVVLQGQ